MIVTRKGRCPLDRADVELRYSVVLQSDDSARWSLIGEYPHVDCIRKWSQSLKSTQRNLDERRGVGPHV